MKIERGRHLSDLTTFGVGGEARALALVESIGEMQEAIGYANSEGLRFLVLGKGSNCLFDDRGFNGLVIVNKIEFVEKEETPWRVGAGFSFSLLGVRTAREKFTGLEFASGIPGTVGGAVVMNAGANGQETCEALESVEVVTPQGELKRYGREDLAFSYRTSPFQANGEAVVAATFALDRGEAPRARQLEILAYRKETQPLRERSSGCMFRNPEGASAGRLIEESGLKGTHVGGAVVSDLHANFLLNGGGATSRDILALIERVKERVYQETGYRLHEEVKYIPYDL